MASLIQIKHPPTALLGRVSTEEQRERQSIETQREFGRRYAELHKIPIVAEYWDEAVSGTVPLGERPDGARLIADAKAGKFKAVLVYRLDRLGRDPRLILNAVSELEALGVQVKSMTEPFDTESAAGRFLLTILSGVAGLERDTIIERSVAGSNRLAREGAWLGGIVPYGYRVQGKGRDAHLVIADERLAGQDLSEADVVRLIYRLAIEEDKSTVVIADYLNQLGVPPSYSRDGRQLLRGKRKQATAGIWRGGRIRNMLTATTYKGIHTYGKRSSRSRDIIERPVPAIVSEEVWDSAQAALRHRFLNAKRNTKRQYLLRGLIKCGLCGLTYQGLNWPDTKGNPRTFYSCDGRHQARGIYGLKGSRCPSKAVNGRLEDVVWQDIEGFLRDPGETLRQLVEQQKNRSSSVASLHQEANRLEQALAAKERERDSVIGLFRRGRISESALDRQLDEIQSEEMDLQTRIAELRTRVQGAEQAAAHLRTVEDFLRQINEELEEPLTWERKRRIVELLVAGIVVHTTEQDGKKLARTVVTYSFNSPVVATRTGTDSSLQPGESLPDTRHCRSPD